jgi:hypothetical protein
MEIPSAKKEEKSSPSESKTTEQSSYEFQRDKCVEKLKSEKEKRTVTIFLTAYINMRIVKELETKGYNVEFTTSYKNKKIQTTLFITNPEIKTSNPMSELMDCFDGINVSSSPEMNENMKKMFINFFSPQ